MQENGFFGAGVIVGDLLKWGYPGAIYPVHPTTEWVYGLRVYRDLSEVDGIPDLAVIVTSWRHCPGILEQCGRKGVRSVVVVSDGFSESGPEGVKRQEALLAMARSYGIRIMGPNTVGIFNAADRTTTVPYDRGYPYETSGGLSIITQTGMYSPQAMAWHEYAPGVNKVIDLGNMCDIDETDCLEYLAGDEGTGVIALYMEHTRRPRAFVEAARRASLTKPVLCLKPGTSPGAARAMASHTGSLAGDDKLYDGLLRQAGLLRVEEYEDLRDCASPFLRYPLPKGNRLGILTFSGAIGIQCIDAAEATGLTLGTLSASSRRKLSGLSDTLGGHPIDVGPASATVGVGIFDLYQQCFDVLADDDGIDLIYVNTYVSHGLQPELYEKLFRYMGSFTEKPVVAWSYGPFQQAVLDFGTLAETCGIPFYATSKKAVRTLSYMARYARWRGRPS